jgi:hypothetical protein
MEERVVEQHGLGGIARLLNAAWIRPFLFLIFIVVVWDLTIRLFRIPPYHFSGRCAKISVGDERDKVGDVGGHRGGKLRAISGLPRQMNRR